MNDYQRKQLLDVLPELEPLFAKRHLLGGRENATTQDLMRRIDRLLNPDDPEQLVNEVRAHVQTFGKYVGSHADHEAECEAGQKAAEARRAEVYAAAHAKQAAEVARKKEYQAAAVARRAVDEVI